MFVTSAVKLHLMIVRINKETIWLTGIPCSGKTTIANELKEELVFCGYNVITLDGDEVRDKLKFDIGFSDEDRIKHLERVSSLCQMLNEKGLVIIASFVSPLEKMRKIIAKNIKHLKIIYVDCSVEECIRRDVKGMYKKSLRGEIKNFTGLQAPYEPPVSPYMVINTEKYTLEECVKQIMAKLLEKQGEI